MNLNHLTLPQLDELTLEPTLDELLLDEDHVWFVEFQCEAKNRRLDVLGTNWRVIAANTNQRIEYVIKESL